MELADLETANLPEKHMSMLLCTMVGFSAHCISTIIRVNSAFKTDAECQGLPTQKHKLLFLDKKAFVGTGLQDN